MPSEVEAIEAILRESAVTLGDATEPDRYYLVHVPEAAAAIAALRARDREDGAREMRGRAVLTTERFGRGSLMTSQQVSMRAAIGAAIRALPLSPARTEVGDA